jgi:hypothetical protein
VFVLIRLEVQAVAHELDAAEVGPLLGLVVAVWVALIIIRFVFAQLSVFAIMYGDDSFTALVRFESAEAAKRSSDRPGQWPVVVGIRLVAGW